MKLRILLDAGEYETLATNLQKDFTINDIKELYHARWGIETAFRDLKYNIGITNLYSKNDEFAMQKISAIGLSKVLICSRTAIISTSMLLI